METIIKYATDEDKEARLIMTIKNNPGINTNRLSSKLNISSRLLQKLVRELSTRGDIILKNSDHGAILHYVKPSR